MKTTFQKNLFLNLSHLNSLNQSNCINILQKTSPKIVLLFNMWVILISPGWLKKCMICQELYYWYKVNNFTSQLYYRNFISTFFDSLVNMLALPLVKILSNSQVNMLDRSLVNILVESLMNLMSTSLVNMLTKSLVTILYEH